MLFLSLWDCQQFFLLEMFLHGYTGSLPISPFPCPCILGAGVSNWLTSAPAMRAPWRGVGPLTAIWCRAGVLGTMALQWGGRRNRRPCFQGASLLHPQWAKNAINYDVQAPFTLGISLWTFHSHSRFRFVFSSTMNLNNFLFCIEL